MVPNKEEIQQKRFSEIREAMLQLENMEALIARVMLGVLQVFNLIPTGKKRGMPRLTKFETAAVKSLTTSAFKLLNPEDFNARPVKYRAGLAIGMLVEGIAYMKRQKPSPEEEAMLYSLIIPVFGLGNEVNDEAMKKLGQCIENLKRLFATSVELPQPEFAEFMAGYNSAKKFYTDCERPFSEIADRQQIYLLILLLSGLGKSFRSGQELQKFAKTETCLKLQTTPDEFKKSLNLIHWTGAKYSRAMRKKKKVDRAKKRSPVN